MTHPIFEQPDKPTWLTAAEISALLLVSLCALYSLISTLYAHYKASLIGYIKLPSPQAPAQTRGEEFGRQLLHNVDDLPNNNGDYVQEARFWKTVIPLRIAFLLPVFASAVIQCFSSYRAITEGPTHWGWTSLGLISGVCVIQAVLSLTYNFTNSVPRHEALTYHLFSIAAFLFLYSYITTLGQYLVHDRLVILTWIDYSAFGLPIVQMISVGSIPCSPKTRFDLKRVYSKAVATNLLKAEENQALAAQSAEEVGGGKSEEANMIAEDTVSIISQMILAWVVPVISKVSQLQQADITDLPALHHYLRTQDTVKDALGYAKTKISPERWGVTRAFLWEVWVPQWHAVAKGVGIQFLLKPLWYLPHIALQQVLASIELGLDRRTAAAWAIMLVIGKLVGMLVLLVQLSYTGSYASPRIRAHTQYLLYSKILTRNLFATPDEAQKPKVADKKQTPASKADILNLISVDVSAISDLGFSFCSLLSSQVELILGATYVWILLGTSGLWGLSTLLLTSIPAYFITKLQYKVFEKRLAVSDRKVTLLQEAIQAISMIKMMAAERFWYKRIKTVRDEEFMRLTQARLLGFLSGMLYAASPTIIVVVAFAHYSLVAKKPLTATIAFTSIAVFEELRPVLLSLPEMLAECLQQVLSAKRIGVFIVTQDVDYLNESVINHSIAPPDAPLYFQGTVAWSVDHALTTNMVDGSSTTLIPAFRLKDIDLSFTRGEITLIAGRFGAGKTLMLLALMGEACLLEGKISYALSPIMSPILEDGQEWDLVPAGVAYVPQAAWLQSLSIRENILFGLPLDAERYRNVVFAVGLLPDLEILEDGDLTEIGERGKILSGGQKSRVSLARAVYSRASTLILDDVVSAVDAQTSQHIVRHCFKGPLMAGRTVIIASHAVEALAPLADKAIFLDSGRVVWEGTGNDLMSSEHMLHLKEATVETLEEETSQQYTRRGSEKVDVNDFVIKEASARTPRQVIMEEDRAKGAVDTRHWWELLDFNGGVFFWLLMGFLLLCSTLAPVAERHVLQLWTGEGADPNDIQRILFWVVLYSSISGANIILDSIFGLCRFFGGLRAIKRVHSEMLETVLRAKMSFFSRTRAGSIVQRFGKDLNDVLSCSELISDIASSALSMLLALLSVSYYGGCIFAFVAIAVFAVIWQPSVWYRSAGRQIRRLESVSPGLINAIYSETIAGTAVVRAFGAQSLFVSELMRTLNIRINATAWRYYTGRWLFINLKLVDVILISTVLFVILTSNHITAASTGFILAFVGSISGNLNWILIQLRNFELDGISLERTAEYRRLEKEGGTELIEGLADDEELAIEARMAAEYGSWPSAGKLEVQNLSARYGPEMPEILHQISFSVDGGQRVGLVGASGGGKSTLAKALFSFVEISHGRILIDGRDTADIPLGQVRSKLGIIAQDPILLSGTLRLNLDIETQYSDDELYAALCQVQLIRRAPKGSVSNLVSGASSVVGVKVAQSPEIFEEPISPTSSSSTVVAELEENSNIFSNLDFEIKSGGENLSSGQKQLVVLARALLKRHKILILDEATASIDSATDAEISRVVHEEFAGATVLIIAHRLRTIMPCSKILVMDKGNLVQQGSPVELIRQSGKFQQLCMAAGAEEYRQLVALAEKEAKKGQLVDVDA